MGKMDKTTMYHNIDNNDLNQLITNAQKVIVPLSPISVFAARSPWANLEDKNFDDVAQWLREVREVDMYPAVSTILEAKDNGEIAQDKVDEGLEQWLQQTTAPCASETLAHFVKQVMTLKSLQKTNDKAQYAQAKQFATSLARSTSGHKSKHAHLISAAVTDDQGTKISDYVDYHVMKWCKLYVDDAQAGWTMPDRERGFFASWYRLVQHDPALTKQERQRIKTLPNDSELLLNTALQRLGIDEGEIQSYLEQHLLALPGWAGMMLWQEENDEHEDHLIRTYLAIRLALEWCLVDPYLPIKAEPRVDISQWTEAILQWLEWGGYSVEAWSQLTSESQLAHVHFALHFNHQVSRKIWLEAWEETYQQQMKDHLEQTATKVQDETITPTAQLAFCIDVRSEPFRRQIEKAGHFETIGIAGFFGLPIAKSELGKKHSHPSLPVMNQPQHKIKEYTAEREPTAFQQRKHVLQSVTYTFKKMKQNALPSLLLPELSGPWLTLQTITRSFIPRRTGNLIRKFYGRWLQKPQDTTLTLDYQHEHEDHLPIGFTDEEKIAYAKQALTLMNLTKRFAPLVVFCGHGSHSANNPYAASLDCGACGGAASGFNAKVLAQLCNLPEVRAGLANADIVIPSTTVFASAEHHTSVDELAWVYLPELPEAAQDAYEALTASMPEISRRANQQRLSQLPNNHITKKDPIKEVHRLANDWSEIRPEWGLAKNASFIIGERSLTKDINLEGRAFLHNYNWKYDEDGSILANIISGPATVAQWINLQYYASTVAPHYYGSGNKITQTVTAGIGVMQGNASDLLTGLPWQSVMSADNKMYHSPIRLLIVVQAPQHVIVNLLDALPDFRQKVNNGWVRLASIDHFGDWKEWSN
ncbi:Na-translocating system protein MpsB [Staphylococcus gallinarum]|uniref:DUF2309 domain-containing protein n=1 Tax=Staphylococcus gallinarum TaxID=1293 RepID=UPI001E5DCA8F|nr:putative inorganic carbon transporter subunit DabA [Staphylococcus gallinarum]MCD8909310.1 Na-translocating system protein MpsB [Staphylococcus gallinarum]